MGYGHATVSKGRHFTRTRPDRIARGEGHGKARLTAVQVRVIRASDESARWLAITFGVTDSHIRSIRRGRVWRAA